MNRSIAIQDQLLATKFFVPTTSGVLISRPRLSSLLDKGLKQPFTLVSAPAGFGKTTFLSAWIQSQPANHPLIAWVSLDEEDNEPQLFWTYIVTALTMLQRDLFTSILMQLQSPQSPPLRHIIVELINILVEATERFVLILDDYHLITNQQIHTTLLYLLQHLPIQLHIIISTRTDPPLPLSQLRAHHRMSEIPTDQLRCTAQETKTLFNEALGIQLSDEIIQEVTTHTEGWLVGLRLLALSLEEQTNPLTIVQEVSGNQRYILDYLTQEVLQRQPQDVQAFLLSTSILEHLSASLCNSVAQISDSYLMLERLREANLFVVSLDSKCQWYRYHALFAEALRYRLEQQQGDLVPHLHYRASLWYAEHNQVTQAILHAFKAHQWQWVSDLIEAMPAIMSLTWGVGEDQLVLLRQWIKQLPVDVVRSRPRLCLACAQMLCMVASHPTLEVWLDTAEAILTASLGIQASENALPALLSSEELQKQQNLLGEVIAFRALMRSYEANGQSALPLCQQALALLPAENYIARTQVACAQFWAYYTSSANDAFSAIQSGLYAISLAQTTGQTTLVLAVMGPTALHMITTGQLHEALRLTQQAMLLGTKPEESVLPGVGWSLISQADILREWNQLDTALLLAKEAIELCKQTQSIVSPFFLHCGYAVLLRIYLSRGELEQARSAFQLLKSSSRNLDHDLDVYVHSFFTAVDQVRLQLACGEMDHTTYKVLDPDLGDWYSTYIAQEREIVAYIRILLAKAQPDLALKRLEHVLERATTGQRWGHVIELRLLQVLAYQMCSKEMQALDALSEAIRLAEPEGYTRSFVEEGAPMESLLRQLQKRYRKHGPTPYLDTVLAAFQQETTAHLQAGEPTKAQPLLEPLSKRELHVLQLLCQGASNKDIAQELVIAIDTVKRHVSHIFAKLNVQNRVQAARLARELGLLNE